VVTHDPHHALTFPTALRCLTAATTLTVVAAVAACGDGASTPPTTAAPTPTTATTESTSTSRAAAHDIGTVLERGAAFVAPQLGSIDLASGSLFAYLYRKWAVAGLAGAEAAVQQRLASGQIDPEERLLLRLADRTALPVPVPPDTEPTTAVIAPALQCDRRPLDADDLGRLRALAAGGGYSTTHAALAIGFMGELGCEVPTDTRETVLTGMAAELSATAASPDPPTDLAAEQSAMLHYLGAPERIPDGWNARLLDAQRDDGGWGPPKTPSTWHMTLLAMWTLAASSGPGAPVGVLAPR